MPRVGLTPARVATEAADLADEVGFEHLTTSELARRLGVRPASLYSHVRGTDDLRARVTLLALDELAQRLADAVAGRSGAAALSALGHVHRDYARERPGRYAAARHRLDPEAAAASAGPRIARTTRAVLAGYDLTEADETHAVRMLGGFFHGFVQLELAGAFDHSDPPSADSWDRGLSALDTMLRGWSQT